jgi:hypothetical protein
MTLVPIAVLVALVIGPAALGLMGAFQREAVDAPSRRDFRLTAASTLLYALAFNLVFFVQELFLVLPKAFVPGLHPTLFHNNHDWAGDNPVAELLQGTGALAILLLGLACAAILALRPPRSTTARLLVFWLAFHGLFMALAQVVVAAMIDRQDVSRAMTWLGVDQAGKTVAAMIALAAIITAAIWLTPRLLAVASGPGQIATRRRRAGFAFLTGVLPAIAGTLLIVPFRVPGHPIEVAVVPAAVAFAGLGWLQAGAWRANATAGGGEVRLVAPAIALGVLLAIFQIVLRPGVAFY